MSEEKKQIKEACEKAYTYRCWRNPFGVYFATLFDRDENAFFEFQYDDSFPQKEKNWVLKLFNQIDKRLEKED